MALGWRLLFHTVDSPKRRILGGPCFLPLDTVSGVSGGDCEALCGRGKTGIRSVAIVVVRLGQRRRGALVALGARTAGHWQGAHATPIDAVSVDGAIPLRDDGHGNSANRYEYKFGITVNTLGQRFYDEGEAKHSYTYAKTGRAVLAQPRGLAYQIFDKKGYPLFREGNYQGATLQEAATIAELAKMIGLSPDVLVHTVEAFNAACQDHIPFEPGNMDGKHTVGITPKKSNWAIKIDAPPYRAYPVTCGITFTFGGLQINTRAEVLNTADKPIRGLYASGDVVGLFFHNYPGNTGQTRNAVFSRVAGREAAGRNA